MAAICRSGGIPGVRTSRNPLIIDVKTGRRAGNGIGAGEGHGARDGGVTRRTGNAYLRRGGVCKEENAGNESQDVAGDFRIVQN